MWPHDFASRRAGADRDRFVIVPHHPDRLRRPAAPPGRADERFTQALLWNVFRSLELISPSFWLRRLHLRLTGSPSLVPPQIVSVRLWPALPLPPVHRLDGAQPDVALDVLIETEHTVWTLVADSSARDLLDSETTAAIVDAGRWFAGVRAHHCGVITLTPDRRAAVLQARYARSRESARLRSASRGPAAPVEATWGGVHASELAALLQDCAEADSLPAIERAAARTALDWLAPAGVHPRGAARPLESVSG